MLGVIQKQNFVDLSKRFPNCNLFIWIQNLPLYLGFCFFRNCFYYPWSSTLQRLVRMSSASCSGNVQTLVISVLVESSRELSLAWENKVFLELTLPGLISRLSPPISMTYFFPLILSAVMVVGRSLLLRFSQLTSSVAEIASSTNR